MKDSIPRLISTRLLCALVASACIAAAGSAQASGAGGAVILPNAVSYEYFGLNYANNIVTSNTVGTLDYSGHPGCGGTCTAITQLGASPSVSATVNEVYFDIYRTGGGGVQSSLGYYVEYLNTDGLYNVNLHATDSLSAADGAAVSASLRFGQAGPSITSFNNFTSLAFQEADCLNRCPSPGFAIPTAPFSPNNQVQMVANQLYFIQMDVLISPISSGIQNTGMIDPTFSSAFGGQFIFSPGVFAGTSAVPEPSIWAMMLLGFGGLGAVVRRRRSRVALAA